jgi:hypothetical protein
MHVLADKLRTCSDPMERESAKFLLFCTFFLHFSIQTLQSAKGQMLP